MIKKKIVKKTCLTRFLICFVLFCLFFSACSDDYVYLSPANDFSSSDGRTIYSWNREVFEIETEEICSQLNKIGIKTIYQGLYPADFCNPRLPEIVAEYREKEVEVAYLVGDPSWNNAETVIQWALEPLVKYNDFAERKSEIRKVCFDIEFFNSQQGTTFEEFSSMMAELYKYCKEYNLEVVLCIPFWIPDVYGEEEFEILLDSTDVLSCSVFLVGHEEELLQTIIATCNAKDKHLEAILDIQPENEQYKVRTSNTYYHKGLTAVLRVFEELETKYGINSSIHHLSEYRKQLNTLL